MDFRWFLGYSMQFQGAIQEVPRGFNSVSEGFRSVLGIFSGLQGVSVTFYGNSGMFQLVFGIC